jgi:orotidine-5'-phosphate decarboxylase
MNLKLIESEARTKLCLPLDGLRTMDALEERVAELSDYVGLFKVGKASYTRFGPEAIHAVHRNGGKVFLDLKYHDIPETVKDASMAAAALGVYMFNVHTSGGKDMMIAAMEGAHQGALEAGSPIPRVIGVTVLTSLDEDKLKKEVGMPGTVADNVYRLAKNAEDVLLNGIVCSAEDIPALKSRMRKSFMYVTPGIKGPDGAVGKDQARVSSPYGALMNGSSILVVGRAITDKPTPEARQEAAYNILKDMARAL